jgi:dTDP-4-dehydrorhamnose reductase
MIFLFGATGYVGGAFRQHLEAHAIPFRAFTRKTFDYTKFPLLVDLLRSERPSLVVNAAGFTGKPNVDACENLKAETIQGNIVLAQTVAQACDVTKTRLGFVSSGCIFSGGKVRDGDGSWSVRTNINTPDLAKLLEARSPQIRGFTELDEPNFTFQQGNCSFYSGTKAVAEQVLAQFPDIYIWRLRIPFDEQDGGRNYLSKIQRYEKAYQNWNSLSHLADFVSACLQTVRLELPGGLYNVVNPGYVSTEEVVRMIQKKIRPDWQPVFWSDDAEFYSFVKAPRSNCLMDSSKLVSNGIKIRPVEEALDQALTHWNPAR